MEDGIPHPQPHTTVHTWPELCLVLDKPPYLEHAMQQVGGLGTDGGKLLGHIHPFFLGPEFQEVIAGLQMEVMGR